MAAVTYGTKAIIDTQFESYPSTAPDFGLQRGTTLKEIEQACLEVGPGGDGIDVIPPIYTTPLDGGDLFPPFSGTPLERPEVLGDGILTASAIAKKIAQGHAYDKHVIERGEFPEIKTRNEFAQLIDDVMTNYEATKSLSRGRQAYWKGNTVVITDPANRDSGTAFRPWAGKTYYDNLR